MKNVLIIDDNKDILESIQKGLCRRLKDCNILTALDGEAGAQILKTEQIDLIVTDLEMQVLNGYHFIERARKELPAIPICVMTGGRPPGVVERLRTLGVTRIIGKPFLLDRLADVITEELNPETGMFSPGTSGNA